ncbi:hypothetical protein UPYG_G00041290 [Umbra pygmaea]|uniref:Uncharacterized protein n=1 Tax=Umbra pygmaea TaxID=75934 RepID=A0ABD0XSD3_UMBPY
MMSMKLLVLVMCLIALCSSIPVSDREARSSSGEWSRGYGGYYPYMQQPYMPYQSPQYDPATMAMLQALIARLAPAGK